jgi:hypothetical protein
MTYESPEPLTTKKRRPEKIEQDVLGLWQTGFAPPDALEQFCSPEFWNAYSAELNRKTQNDDLADLYLWWQHNRSGEPIPAMPGIPTYVRDREATRLNLRRQLEAQIRQQFEKSELIPVGFVLPRTLTDGPQIIPLDVFDTDGWSFADAISINGLRIEGIRIAKPAREKPEQPISNRPGRWSRREQIRKAIVQLIEQDKISTDATRRPQWPIIRSRVIELFPTDIHGLKGLGDDVIDDEFRKKIEELRSIR